MVISAPKFTLSALILLVVVVVDSYTIGNKVTTAGARFYHHHNTGTSIGQQHLRKRDRTLFDASTRSTSHVRITNVYLTSSSVPSDVEPSILAGDTDINSSNDAVVVVNDMKRQLLELCASYDRGFGASPSSRQVIDTTIRELEEYNTARAVASTIIFPAATTTTEPRGPNFSINGNWRMIYTSALDVLSLQASPIFITGAIYQVFNNSSSIVTNIIDFIPRIQSSFPSSIVPNTLLRAKVQTRACLPQQYQQYPNRIGLIFESVSIQPIQIFGLDGTALPPLAFDLPKLPSFGASSSSSSSSTTVATGYFDVTYLDETLLIIKQNAPGGLFCLLRTNTIDP